MKNTYSHMTNEEFIELLEDYGNGHTAIHEAAKRMRELIAAQQPLAPDVAYWLCKTCGAHQYKDFDTCGDCNTPRR